MTDFIKRYNQSEDNSVVFLQRPIDEIHNGIKTLNKGKTAGYDNIIA